MEKSRSDSAMGSRERGGSDAANVHRSQSLAQLNGANSNSYANTNGNANINGNGNTNGSANGEYSSARPSYTTAPRREYGLTSTSFTFDDYGDGVDIDDIGDDRSTVNVGVTNVNATTGDLSPLAAPLSPLLPSSVRGSPTVAARMSMASSAGFAHYSVRPPLSEVPPTATPSARPRLPPTASSRSIKESLSYLNETPIEEYVAKYQVIKCSWRGKYERIFALGPTRFCTIDPKDFEVTNTWPLTSLLNVTLEEGDPEGFALSLKGVKKDELLKLKCRFRSNLLSDLYRQQERNASHGQRTQTQFPCAKWARKGINMDGLVEVGKDGLSFLRRDGSPRSTYLYVEMTHVSVMSGSSDGFAFGYDGRQRLFFSERRNHIVALINAAAVSLGLALPSHNGLTVASVQQERKQYGTDVGQAFVQFQVHKLTRKHAIPVERTLSLHQNHLVELDVDGGVVSCSPYDQIYVLVRSPRNQMDFDIQLLNGSTIAHYSSRDRDGFLAAIYDLCVTCNANSELFITSAQNERGLRLLPSFATEDTAETHSFFGDTSIGICFLQRMTAVGKFSGSRRSSADRGFITIVQEFNANVPASGILYDTRQSIIVEALRPIGAQLYFISKGTPIASRSAVTLLQAMFRISSSYYGFREVAQAPHLAEALTNVLANGDEFAVFWVMLVLKRLTVHTVPSSAKLDGPSLRSSEDVEAYNKSVLFGNAQLVHTLIGHLNGVDVRGSAPSAEARHTIGPLVIMGLLQTLEGSLSSRKATTAPSEFQLIINESAKFYGTLLKILFQSRCATTVEACTLLLKTIVEECDPAVATQIRDAALAEGIVLRHFYQAIFDSSFDQRSVSRYLISLWMSHHPPSKQLLSRILPTGFMQLLDVPLPSAAELSQMDQIEREQSNGHVAGEVLRLSSLSDEQLYGHEGWSNPGETEATQPGTGLGAAFSRSSSFGLAMDSPSLARDRRSMSSTFDTRSSLAVAAVSARETIVVQIENDYTKSRMLKKLQSSFLVTSTRSGTNLNMDADRMSESTTARASSRASKRDSAKSGGHSGLDESQRVRKRDVAYDFISSAIIRSKTQRPHPTKLKGHARNSPASAYMKDDRSPENFRILFHALSEDNERVDLIWNANTRAELKRGLLREIQQFGVYQNRKASGKAVWNYEDFRVEYPRLRKELVVGGCYLRVLCSRLASDRARGDTNGLSGARSGAKEDSFVVFGPDDVGVRNPRRLIEHLYRRILRENIKAEHHNELEMMLACSQGLAIVASAYAGFDETTELDELNYIMQLMLDTVHAPVLEGLLRAVRALALARPNARKLLEKDAIIDTLVSLLQLGHVSDRSHSVAPPKPVWRVEEGAEATLDPVSVEDLHGMVTSKKISPQSCRVVRRHDNVCEHSVDGSHSQSLLENLQLRWEVGIQGKLATDQVACDAMQTLLLIAHSNMLIENPATRNSLFPIVRAKNSIQRRARDILPLIARYNHPLLSEKTAKLLNFVYDDATLLQQRLSGNDDLARRSSLYLWGLFYLVFLVDTLNFEDFAGLLKSTHLHQDGFDGGSALVGLFPEALIDVLEKSSPQEFTQVFNGAVSSPDVIWSRDMRLHLRDNCLAHLDDYLEILQEDVQSRWQFCPMAPVTFAELEDEVWCDGAYLGKFCERDEFVIDQPVEFMTKLTRTWRQEVDRIAARFTYEEASAILGVEFQSTARDVHPTYRAAFKARARELQDECLDHEAYGERIGALRESYRIVTCPRHSLLTEGHDPVNLLRLLDAMIAVCDRYGAKLRESYFDSYDLLLALLQSHSTKDGAPPPHTSEEQRLLIPARAAELLFRTCAVSARNADLLLKQAQDLETLEKVVCFCVDQMVAGPEQYDSRIDSVCCFVLQTITGLLASQAGRMWISDTSTLIVDMGRLLWYWNQAFGGTHQRVTLSKTVQQVLESISRMTLLKANQERILQTGAVWQLIVLFARYDIALDEAVVRSRLGTTISSDEEYEAIADEVQNLLAIMAVRALCRLGGFFSLESEFASPRNEDLVAALEALFTPNLSRLLLLENHHEFLTIFHGECESYTLFWNDAMRQEMLAFVRPRSTIEPEMSTDEDYSDAIKFRFDHLAIVFALGDVYIDALVSSLMILQQSEVPTSLNDLGLTERFFRELFAFIDNGKLPQLAFKVETNVDGESTPANEGEVLAFRPHSGWHLQQADLESTYRVTALNCLALASGVLPYLIERHVSADAQVIKLLLRQLFPPDNEVHQSEEGEAESLVFPEELYEPARHHCIVILQALSSLNGFGRASYDVGICDILIEVVNMCREVGPEVLRIIANLCRTPARADFVSDILQTGPYIEFIGWLVGVETVEADDEKELADALRIPVAELLAEMARSTAALSVESRAMLSRFFPASVTDHLVSDPQTFISFYQSDHETPELVWNSSTREFLRNNLHSLLSEYYSAGTGADEEESIQLRDTMRSRLEYHVVDYSTVYPEAAVGNVYLNLYLRNPTYRLRDPLFFVRCLWTEYETLYGDLSHLSSSLRETRSPDDELMSETGERFLDLVTASLVCALRTHVWILDELAIAKIPERCCLYLNECVRNNLSEACSVAVVRMLRVFSTSKKCVATMQPMGSNLITCLLSQMSRSRNGVLYRESAYTLEIVRRLVINFPSTIANGEGIVTVAMRVDLFSYLLNIVENPAVLGPVRQPQLARTIAIDILNTLEKDRLQARAAHDILKKNKKWEKKIRHEGSLIPMPADPEDPFLQHHSPQLDRQISGFAATAPSARPTTSNRTVTFDTTASGRGTMMDKFRHSPRRGETFTDPRSERVSVASSTGGVSRMAKYKRLFSRHD